METTRSTAGQAGATPSADDPRPVVTSTTDPQPPGGTDGAARGGIGVLGLLLGGFLAGCIGYAMAYFTEFGLFDTGSEERLARIEAQIAEQQTQLSDPPAATLDPEAESRIATTEEGFSELTARLEALEGDVSALGETPDAPVDDATLADLEAALRGDVENAGARIATLEEAVAQVTGTLAALDLQELEGLQQRVAALGEEIAQQQSELAAQQEEVAARLEEQRAAIAAAEDVAETETRRVQAQAALSQIRAAVEEGTPFQDALGALAATSDIEVPEPLPQAAPEGIATLSELRSDYPSAARAALDASLSETAGDGAGDRMMAFLRAQTGARSLSERAGDDPDAVLSRAEARLDEGDLQAAIDELGALPQAGRDAMSDWLDAARTRLAAQAAVAQIDQAAVSN